MFLKTSRTVKTRTDANRLCGEGRVLVNGSSAKASRPVTVGDVITIEIGESVRTIEVLTIPANKQVSKSEARDLIREIDRKTSDD